ncbi:MULTISPECIES: glycosyl hydrolase family 18 protein [unclassified Colwellia]|uniref:glycosyl hydrolase family 18 protein n=1 Tax=unclassified Colwellia TaxID=196834 RepID=UPI0015F3EA94|nr:MULTISPECIES: glycosyl hydrolase family 18 protein [unclassified Colwellia]MBA6232162.1 chitinase [Colwellia sp. MB02u-7]MBA6237140.1 chitinase [Colwellia sp. MB02u-11]MBA6257428.1 chitinase [Colwellia sp. MB3u-28]MBA6260500.1 chitinase [Colwellia sp. MB3u-41]MBA6301596.1 chitinase [Colwellia sp. MB3u-22]
MKKLLLTACAISTVIASWQVLATASKPSIDWAPQDYSFVQVNLDGQGSYKDLVTTKTQVDINIKWNAWSGTGGDNYKVYFDDIMVNEGNLTPGSNSGVINFTYSKSGRHNLTIELCDADGCVRSDAKALVIADTDGSHLQPLTMDVNPNNKTYQHQQDTVVGAYFVEWGIYGRDFDVSNIPAQNLTHILYGFIPICGANESLKEIENGNSWRVLQKACVGSADYEVVVHDPFAAFQKALPGIDATDPIRGTYAQLMALKQRYPDLKILPSVGGWTLSDPFHGFTDKANRDTFVASMKTFLQTWKFYDGVDIDWEYPGGSGPNPDLGDPVNDGPAYVALMAELRAMLDELEADTGREYQLTSAIGVGYDKIEDVNYGQAIQYMDYIFAMSYDFFGGWSNVTGHQTGIYCGEHLSAGACDGSGVDDAGEPRKGPAYTTDHGIQQLLAQGVPASQLVVGTAMYGRGWEGVKETNTQGGNPMTAEGTGKLTGTTANGVWEPGIQDYKGLKKVMIGASGEGINGFETFYDEQAEAAYVWNKTSGTLVTYDSPRSVNAKGQYVRSLGLAGLFAWEIDADNGDILNAMHEGLAGGTLPNNKPIVNLTPTYAINAGDALAIEATATDSDNDPLSYSWIIPPVLAASGSNTNTVTITAPNVTQNTEYVLSLSVSDGKATVTKSTTVTVLADDIPNNPPVIEALADITLDENKSAAVNVIATDADNDNLTYSWSVPAGLTQQGNGANVTLLANDVTQDTQYTVTVDVSDSKSIANKSFKVTVKNTDSGGVTTWDSNTIYNTGDKVKYNGVEYRAKWWTRNDQPDDVGPWEEVIPDNGQVRDWKATTIYNAGDQVIYNNNKYQAQWWTKGNTPGAANVWTKL